MEVKQPFSDDIGDLLAPCGLANLKKKQCNHCLQTGEVPQQPSLLLGTSASKYGLPRGDKIMSRKRKEKLIMD